jgi:uncharacterized protein YbdZ (MbtH family)
MRFSSGLTTLSTPKTITLTLGDDDSPQANYIYVLESDQTQLTKSTSQWPATEHIKVGWYLIPSATFVSNNGPYIQQQWNDHNMGTDNMGHMAHMAERERLTAARYFSGIEPNGTTSYLTISGATVYYKATSGIIFQMHEHASPAVNTDPGGAGDIGLVANWNGDAFHDITNLFDIIRDSGANLIGNNKWFNLVFWGVANKAGTYEPIMINLPSGFYNTQASAEQDISGFDNFDLPREFDLESSTGFLIARLTVQKQAGTWAFGSVVDLRRGDLLGARGGASSPETEFPDNTFNIFDATDNTKVLAFQADQIAAGNTRTITMPDGDVTFSKTAGAVMAGDGTDVVGTVPKRSIIIRAEGLRPNTTDPCADAVQAETGTGGKNYVTRSFAANEQASMDMFLPENYDGGTVTWWYSWISPTGSSAGDTVIFGLRGSSTQNGDLIGEAQGAQVAITDTLLTGTGRYHKSDESSALTIAGSPSGGDLVIWEIERTGGDMAEEAPLLTVYIRYGTNNASDE